MKGLKVLLIAALLIPFLAKAQDCNNFMSYRKAAPPYRFNTASKSAMCFTGRKYEFVLPLTKGIDYRIQFFASPVFNQNINFKIIDMNTNEVVLDLPGKVSQFETPEKGKTVLQPYMDEKLGKMVNPYFDFFPAQSTSLKIIIDVKEVVKEMPIEYDYVYDEWGNVIDQKPKEQQPVAEGEPLEKNKGCITVYITDKVSDATTF